MTYLRGRGFRDDIIKKFQLGYSTDNHNALARTAIQKGYKEEFLVKTGLCYRKEDGTLRDRFWGRVIFPVHTISGKVVAFGIKCCYEKCADEIRQFARIGDLPQEPGTVWHLFRQTSHRSARPLFFSRRLYRCHIHAPKRHRECGSLIWNCTYFRPNPTDSSVYQQHHGAL